MGVNVGTEQVKLMMEHITEIVLEKVPMEKEKLVSYVQFETGYSRRKIEEILKILFDLDRIVVGESDVVSIKETTK